MAVKGKGKEVETPSSSKRKASSSASASKRRRSGVLQFVDDVAYVDEDDDEEEEDESGSDDDIDELFEELAKEGEAPVSEPKGKGKGFLPFLVKEEQLSGDELEELIKERYGSKSGLKYACYEDELQDIAGPDPTKDPTIWRLKCGVGRERQVVFCFMQKYVEFHKRGNRLQIFSAFSLDHVKGYVFVEADKASDVIEACKGFCNVYVTRINAVPASEVSHLLANRSKPSVLSEGSWVRLKSGNYKGDIAQVVSMDDAKKNVLIKLVPRIDFHAISKKFGGAISLKNAAIPTARLINPRELEVFRPHIELRRDRQSGEMFEVLDGNMFKDGYLYKRVALNSLICWGVQPTASERVKFSPPSVESQEIEPEEWVSDLYNSRRKKKQRASTSADLKASTSEPMDDSAFGIHDLVLFGKKDFGVILGIEKDGSYKMLTGDMEGVPVVTIKKQEIKKVCADKMFTALDRNKKSLSINDPVDVSEGPAEGKKGVVKHMFKGVLFIYGENETENGGLFCAKAVHCVNTKNSEAAPPPTMQSFSENLDEDAGPSFAPSSPGLFQSSFQQDSIRASGRRRQERESLFSIGQMLRIRKGPLKGYLCRVVRMYRNDITVKLDSLVKLLTVDAEYLTVPAIKGQTDESGAAGSSDIFGVQEMEGGSSWDTGLPSFTSDTWQPFSSSTAPTSGNGVDKSGGDDDPWGSKVPSGTTPDAWNSEKPSDTWGNTSEGQAVRTNTQDGAWQSNDDNKWGNEKGKDEKGKDAVSDDPWGIAVSKGSEGTDAWCQVKNAASNEPNVNSVIEDGWGTSKIEVESGGCKPTASSNWDAKGKGIAIEDNSAWGDKVTKSQDTWGDKSDAWDKSKEEVGGEGGWNSGGNKQKVIDNEDNSAWGDKVTRSQGTATWGGKSDAWGQSTKNDGGGEGCGWNSGGNASWDKPNSSTWNSGLDGGDKGNQPMDSWNTSGGFGGRGGRGNRGSGGSGRGGGRSGGGDCFKCGQSGHFSRECPSAGNSGFRGGGGNCFKCGESGHFSRECPSADGGGSRSGGGSGGGGGGNCYKCGQSGHFSRECPSADGGGFRGGGSSGGNCYKCGESGHFARECPSAEAGGFRGAGSSGGNCYKCGESGHFARECPSAEAGGSRGGGNGGRDCFKCGKPGHFARECPNDGGGEGGTWKSDKSGRAGFRSCWSNDQAGSNAGKVWDNSNSGELQRDDPWEGSGAPALSTHTTDAWKDISESKSKGHDSGDNNQQTQECDDPWASNQQTQASSSKAEADAKGADPWSTKSIHDTGTKNQDDPWSTKTDEKNAANDSGGWHTGESSKTQSDVWGKSGSDSDWSKPRVSLTSGNNDNNNDGSGWGRPSWSSEGGGRGRGRGRGSNFGDRNSSYDGGRGRNFGLRDDGNNGGRGGNWRGRGGGQYGGNRGDRGGRNGSDHSTWNGDGNKSFGGSSWNRDDNRSFGGSGGSSWSKDNDSKKSSDWGDGWGNTGEKEKGNSSNESLSFSAWNQGPTEKGNSWGNSGGEEKGKSVAGDSSGWGDGGDQKEKGNSWDKPNGDGSGNWDKGGNDGSNGGW